MSARNTLAAKAERRKARHVRHESSRAVVGLTLARGMLGLWHECNVTKNTWRPIRQKGREADRERRRFAWGGRR